MTTALPPSTTEYDSTAKPTAASTSTMLSVAVVRAPRVAPPPGLLSIRPTGIVPVGVPSESTVTLTGWNIWPAPNVTVRDVAV